MVAVIRPITPADRADHVALREAVAAEGIWIGREVPLDLDHWPWNHAGRRLYEKVGFVQEGYRPRQWRRRNGELWDMVEMGLVLDHTSPGPTHGLAGSHHGG